jgi:radical SAM superfamily enzyme YgiQ (UPF0313 family)
MRILLVIPPSSFLIDDRAFPFLGPLQIAALARDLGHDVAVADLTGYKRRHPEERHPKTEAVLAEAEERLLAIAEDHGSELVGFYSLAAQHPMVTRLRKALVLARPGVVTALGGPHASTAPDKCALEGWDYVVVSDQGGGGGEAGFLEMIRRAEEPRPARRSLLQNAVIKVASRTGAEWEGDLWPLPARDLVDLESYVYKLGTERCTSLVSATGCPFACTYCSHWEGYRKLEGKSALRVQQEIFDIKTKYSYRAFMFYDDEINLRPDFLSDFLPMMRGLNVVWRAFYKSGRTFMRPEIFRAMAESGCVEMCTGAESADPGILKAIKKGATLEDNTAFVELCVAHGIRPKVFTQVGLPGETPETVEALRSWLLEMAERGLRDADVSITTPYEGTPIYDHPEKHAITFDKRELAWDENVVLYKGTPGEYRSYVSHPRLSRDELVAARQYVEDSFRKAAGLAPLLGGAKDDG